MALPSVYSHAEVEARWYAEWEQAGAFKPDINAREGPFTIVIPPPNVTGILHMGHALNNTLQDILIRWRRMQGHAALWVPGTDHAGIATQNVVERRLAGQGISRHDLGREEFVKRVWAWKEQYGSTIVRQLRRLGSSCDWGRQRFTLDEGLSRAVETAFLRMYEAGLIYRGYYLVNWCPRCQTALSDEEVVHEEVKGHLWHIRYPLADAQQGQTPEGSVPGLRPGTEKGVVVATTRPETMLGDVAVAVNPKDDRYRALIGTHVILPLRNDAIPLIADEAVDPAFGTGAVKVTPAHDPVDCEMARRHPQIIGLDPSGRDRFSIPLNRIIFTAEAKMSVSVPERYRGLDRFECRKKVVEDLGAAGLLVKTEDYNHSVGHCYRCKTIIEPRLSPQWFVKMGPLAKLGIEAVERDGLRFVPERWTKVYLGWLRNIRDWCISRQIWWGHRIPIWYHPECNRPEVQGHGRWVDGKYVEPGMIVGHREEIQSGNPPPCPTCGQKNSLIQDQDVLDTWFSSWLWPFSTLGWPDQTKDLATFYPTSVLVTGQDILFFWVARMVMAGKFFLGTIPFRDVYIHGIIRVEGGKKMSKSLGNIIDPLEVIGRMGADALRFSIAAMISEGQDLYLSENKFLLGRNFANKLWNAARLIGTISAGAGLEPERGSAAPVSEPGTFGNGTTVTTVADRWILSRLQRLTAEVTAALEGYRFNEAVKLLHRFVWHEFCDWYLEVAKLQRQECSAAACRTDRLLRTVLERVLRLLHPVMPFITEELWRKMGEGETIMRAPWPEPQEERIDPEAEGIFGRLQAVVTEVRNIRSTFRVPVKEKVALFVQPEEGGDWIRRHEKILQRLGGIERITVQPPAARPAGSVVSHLPAQGPFGAWDLIVPLAGLVDLAVERKRIEKEVQELEKRAKSKRDRLEDTAFRSRAPADVVEEEEESLKELESQAERWAGSLRQIR